MSCGGGQKTLIFWVPSIPIPAPSSKRLLSHLSRLDVEEALIAWFQLIDRNGSASIEDVYDHLGAEPEVRSILGRTYSPFGSTVEAKFKEVIERRGYNIVKVDEVPSRRPSRRGAPVGVWAVRRG